MPKGYKQIVPQYWWDFERGTTVLIIESTHKKYPIVARFQIPRESLDARPEIEKAEKMIADLESGRLTPSKVAKQFSISAKKAVKHARNISR